MTGPHFIRDSSAWTTAIQDHGVDLYYEHDYVALGVSEGGAAELFVFSQPTGTLLYPYICRPVIGTPHTDIITAYGYGGPLLRGEWTLDQVLEAKHAFRESCRRRSVITETVRFHPLLDQAVVERQWVDRYRPLQITTYVDLARPLTAVLDDIDKRSQRNIRKAERDGVSVRTCGAEGIETFLPLYWETMDKRHAAGRYYFGEPYFGAIFNSDRLDAEFLFAEREGQVIGGCLLLYGPELAHYHLGASAQEHLSYRPNHLLFREMIIRCHERGMSKLHLGGGTTLAPDDSLLRFKQSFTGAREERFALGESVFDPSAYRALCQDLEPTGTTGDAPPWFPLYRRPDSRPVPTSPVSQDPASVA